MADTAVTLPRARKTPLSLEEQASTGFNTKFRVLYSDIAYGTGSTDTVTVTLGTTADKFYVNHAAMNVTTAFAGTTALTVTVGTTTSVAALVASTSVLTAGFTAGIVDDEDIANATATAAKSLVAVFTNATGGSPSALTAGQLDIYLNLKNAATLP